MSFSSTKRQTAPEFPGAEAAHPPRSGRLQDGEGEARLRAETELERHRLQDLLAQAPVAIGLTSGPEHRWNYVNEHYVRMTGRNSAADFVGKTFRESFPELEIQAFGALLDEVFRTGEPYVRRDVRAKLDRSASDQPEEGYFDFVCQPIRDAAGQVDGILVHAIEVTDKVRARKAIESSEERLRLAQTAAQIGTWEWDPVQNAQTLSPELHKMFATNASEPDHVEKWASRIHLEDREKVQQLMHEGHRAGEMEFEYRYHHPELGLRWFYCKGRRLQEETRMFGILQDITERKRADEALRQSEERFRAIVETTPECVKVVAPDGTVLHMNSAGLRIVEADCISMIEGASVYELIAPEDRDRYRAFNEKVCRGEKGSLEFDIIGMKGVRRHMETHAVPLARPDGLTVQLAVSRDVTVRKRAEEGVYRLAAIVESSDDAIISKDLNGIVTSWNSCAERMFGYSAQEMIGRPIITIIPPELQDDERRILETIARGERIQHFETVRVAKSGERLEVSLTISPVKDQAGKIVGAAKIARDITQRKKAELALRTSERLASVGRLAATVAHEINNPLEAVTNLVYLAKEGATLQEVRHYLTAAEEELDRISHLTKQTLGFYRETKRAGAVKVGAVLDQLISVFASRTRNKAIEILPEIRQDPEIHAIQGEIRQLVANLLSNSIDAVEGGGRIRIRVSAAREWHGCRRAGVRLTVADSGPGIPRVVRSKLFEPFFTTKREVGTGLGLWVCKSIVHKHHGSIRLKSSTAPGRSGTAFSVFLPALGQELVLEENLRKAG